MSDDKAFMLCVTAVLVIGSLCLRSCCVTEDTQKHELKVLCLKAGGTYEFSACKLPAKEPCR